MTPFDQSTPPSPGRRDWLKRSGALLAAALGTGAVSSLMFAPRGARAADYKALVCVFMYGGNDSVNTMPPIDPDRYRQYLDVRGELALPLSSLLPLAGSPYGLHPSLSALAPLWDSGHLASVFNVGPLVRPMSKAQFLAQPSGSEAVPSSLFSHSDQEALWETATVHGVSMTGWGGRASAAMGTRNPVISIGNSTRFGVEAQRAPLVLPKVGEPFSVIGFASDTTDWTPLNKYREAFATLHAQPQNTVLGNAYLAQQQDAFEVSRRLEATVTALPGTPGSPQAIETAFSSLISGQTLKTGLSDQLYQVAKLIAANSGSEGQRQIFFVRLDGFDTHADQIRAGQPTVGVHADLLKEFGDAAAAFDTAMKNLGLSDAVTLFTQSDFGRTFAPNRSLGTDHGWGGSHFVLGGAVKGRATYGAYPELVLGGATDIGLNPWELHGRWLPAFSVDQYAATLLRWFGADDIQLDTILPNLRNFGSARNLGFV